ncbi:hypothetical protein OESDEN_05031 [Oesophagostomum dentatum]|uniref:Uncharacterized protein n=1 Tax=Oesophagostomum dentatum TaxID=61180 RepID=A0A0B1TGT7_OESDE|nr:hypothetical protein OESDEN_05031 [Oesophagostomum dentatum]
MYAMNVANDLLVPYAATVIMEVYSENSEYFVEFLYRNETTQPPHPLSLPSCGTRCTVRKFAELYSDMAIIDYAHHDMVGLHKIGLRTPILEIAIVSADYLDQKNAHSMTCSKE